MTRNRQSVADILVVGDVMLDRYLEGVVERMSPEAPVPVVRLLRTFERPGGAANTAVNIAALGGRPVLLGAIGKDSAADTLRALVKAGGVSGESLLAVDGLPTTLKTRLIAGHQQIARFDEERPLDDSHVRKTLCRWIEDLLPKARWAVISDYGKGICDTAVCRMVIDDGRRQGTKVIVDPKGSDFTKYAGAAVITPNQAEAAAVVGFAIRDADDGVRAARQIRDAFGIEAVIVTLGDRGLVVVSADGTAVIPTRARRVFDVTGAGDTVVAMLSVALAEGMSLEEACHLANAAAGLQVSCIGATTVSRQEVLLSMERPPAAANKIVALERLAAVVRHARAEGKRIGFTNGCFDILHHGHVAVLEAAAAECDMLVVGVNSDASIKRLKGHSRPVVPAEARRAVLSALASVSWVCEFDDDTPLELIRAIEPDVLVKGGDYSAETIVGADLVLARGGRVMTVPLVPHASTTRLVDRVLSAGKSAS